MNLLLTLSHFAAQAFFSALWQGTVLILAVTLALRLLPCVTATVRFAVWSAAFLSAAAVPLVHVGPSTTTSAAPLHLGLGWAFAIAACWATLSTIRLTRLAVNALSLRRIWSKATPVPTAAELQATLDTAPRNPELCLSSDVDSPSVIGFLAPRLLIPEPLYATLTSVELHQIVLHECEHLRRRDDWINLLQKLALALFPLNPALWVADRRLGFERELACDAAVITTTAPIAYANALTRLAEHRILSRPIVLALSAWGRQSELARRIYTLLRPTANISPLRTRASLAILSTALAAGTFELAHAPHLISFAETISAPIAEASPATFMPALLKAVPVVYHPPLVTQPTLTPRPSMSRKSVDRRPIRPSFNTPQLIFTPTNTAVETRRTPRQTRPAYLLTTDFAPSYAAVPFADGWLIIQL